MANPTTSRLSRLFRAFSPTEDYRSPVWTLRISPLIALVSIVLAETVWPAGFAHGICLGLATGQLLVLCLASFQISDVTYKNSTQPSDVQNLRITP